MEKRVTVNFTTFGRDLEWMKYSLDSFKKYCKGFTGVTIVVPTWDVDKFLPLESYSTPECPVLIKNFMEYPGKGFVHHLAMKCYADVFSPDADYILHMDPDCLFSDHQTPDDYFVDGKPVLVIEPYDILKTVHPARYNWKHVTEEAVKFNCTHETMCRHPAIHHSWLYKAAREHIEYHHLTPFYDFVIKQKNSYPQGFCEFGALGAIAMHKFPDRYYFIDRKDKGSENDPPPKLWQGWSYTGVHSPDNQSKIQQILG